MFRQDVKINSCSDLKNNDFASEECTLHYIASGCQATRHGQSTEAAHVSMGSYRVSAQSPKPPPRYKDQRHLQSIHTTAETDPYLRDSKTKHCDPTTSSGSETPHNSGHCQSTNNCFGKNRQSGPSFCSDNSTHRPQCGARTGPQHTTGRQISPMKPHALMRQPNLRDIAEISEDRHGGTTEQCQRIAGDHVSQGVIV